MSTNPSVEVDGDDDASIDELSDYLFTVMSQGHDATVTLESDGDLTETIVLKADGINDSGGFRFKLQVFTPLGVMSDHCAAVVEAIMMTDHQKAIDQLIEDSRGPSSP